MPHYDSDLGCNQPALGLIILRECSDMSDDALVTLAKNMNRLISKDGGVYSSNEAAAKGSQGKVSRSTLDRMRNLDKVGATSVGVDKLEGVAKTFGVHVWQLFVPDLDVRKPPRLASEPAPDVPHWPFDLVDAAKLSKLNDKDLARIEAALLLTAAQLGLDIKKAG